MKLFRSKNLFKMAGLCLLLVITLPIDVFGQGRGRRAGQGQDKKCEKFVNCHDARDGRWDGRGPQRQLSWRDRIFGRNRRYRRDDDDDFRRNRRYRRDDDDDDFRGISRRERRERRIRQDNDLRRRGF